MKALQTLIAMKHLLLILFSFLLFSCQEPKEVYEVNIRTYVISAKEPLVTGGYRRPARLYFQSPHKTESCYVDGETYSKYEIGDTIQVLIKYWEKESWKRKP